ncbi:zf-HC2 domain-containing protein [bacterium]|nr:zf-HC2 domain-containing protein [bacterium]
MNARTPNGCNNYYIQAMLVPYAERSLAKSNRAEVEAHLRECRVCHEDVRRLKELMRPLSELSKSGIRPVFDRHLTHDELFAYVMTPDSLEDDLKRDIRLHSFMCRNCREELDIIAKVERDFADLAPSASADWRLPRTLNDILKASKQEKVSLNIEEVEIPWKERLLALVQKINLRLGIIVGIVILLTFCGFCLIMCDSEDEKESVGKTFTTAEDFSLENSWTDMDLAGADLNSVCEAFKKAGYKYRLIDGKLQISGSDAKKALKTLDELRREQPAAPAKEFTVIKDEAGKGPSEAEDAEANASEAENEAAAASYDDGAGEASASTEGADADYYDYGDLGGDSSYAQDSSGSASSSYAEVNESPEESAVAYGGGSEVREAVRAQENEAKPSKTVSAVSVKKTPVKKEPEVHTSQPTQPIRQESEHPVCTYRASVYKQPAGAPPERPSVSEAVVSSSDKASGAPVPLSVPVISGGNEKEKAPQAPAVIRPDSETTVRINRPVLEPVSETAEAAPPAAEVSDFITGGNTYNDYDSVTNKDTVE